MFCARRFVIRSWRIATELIKGNLRSSWVVRTTSFNDVVETGSAPTLRSLGLF